MTRPRIRRRFGGRAPGRRPRHPSVHETALLTWSSARRPPPRGFRRPRRPGLAARAGLPLRPVPPAPRSLLRPLARPAGPRLRDSPAGFARSHARSHARSPLARPLRRRRPPARSSPSWVNTRLHLLRVRCLRRPPGSQDDRATATLSRAHRAGPSSGASFYHIYSRKFVPGKL